MCEGLVSQRAFDLKHPRIAKFRVGVPAREAEFTFVELAEHKSQGIGDPRRVIALLDCRAQVPLGFIEILQREVTAAESVVTGTGCDLSDFRHLLFDRHHPLEDGLSLERSVVQWHHGRDPGHTLDLLGLLDKVLCDGGSSPSLDLGADAEHNQDRHDRDGRNPHRGENLVLADLLADLVDQAGAPGLDGLTRKKTPEILGDFSSCGIAAIGLLFETLENDGLEIRRHIGVESVRWLGFALGDTGDDLRVAALIG